MRVCCSSWCATWLPAACIKDVVSAANLPHKLLAMPQAHASSSTPQHDCTTSAVLPQPHADAFTNCYVTVLLLPLRRLLPSSCRIIRLQLLLPYNNSKEGFNMLQNELLGFIRRQCSGAMHVSADSVGDDVYTWSVEMWKSAFRPDCQLAKVRGCCVCTFVVHSACDGVSGLSMSDL